MKERLPTEILDRCITRRQLLGAVSAGTVSGLAGCISLNDPESQEVPTTSDSVTAAESRAVPTTSDSVTAGSTLSAYEERPVEVRGDCETYLRQLKTGVPVLEYDGKTFFERPGTPNHVGVTSWGVTVVGHPIDKINEWVPWAFEVYDVSVTTNEAMGTVTATAIPTRPFQVAIGITYFQWNPQTCMTTDEWSTWQATEAAIIAHERRHRDDAIRLTNAYNDALTGKPLAAVSASTETEARDQLRRVLALKLRDHAHALSTEIGQAGDDYHSELDTEHGGPNWRLQPWEFCESGRCGDDRYERIQAYKLTYTIGITWDPKSCPDLRSGRYIGLTSAETPNEVLLTQPIPGWPKYDGNATTSNEHSRMLKYRRRSGSNETTWWTEVGAAHHTGQAWLSFLNDGEYWLHLPNIVIPNVDRKWVKSHHPPEERYALSLNVPEIHKPLDDCAEVIQDKIVFQLDCNQEMFVRISLRPVCKDSLVMPMPTPQPTPEPPSFKLGSSSLATISTS